MLYIFDIPRFFGGFCPSLVGGFIISRCMAFYVVSGYLFGFASFRASVGLLCVYSVAVGVSCFRSGAVCRFLCGSCADAGSGSPLGRGLPVGSLAGFHRVRLLACCRFPSWLHILPAIGFLFCFVGSSSSVAAFVALWRFGCFAAVPRVVSGCVLLWRGFPV